MLQIKKIVLWVMTAFLILNLLGLIYTNYRLDQNRAKRVNLLKIQQQYLLSNAAQSLDSQVSSIQKIANQYAKLFSINYSLGQLNESIQANSNILNMGILGLSVVDPDHHFVKHKKSNAVYWANNGSLMESSFYLYNKSPASIDEGYTQIDKSGMAFGWTKPYYDKDFKDYTISYVVPVYAKDSTKLIAKVIFDVDMKVLEDVISENLGEKFATVINTDGYYILDMDINKVLQGTPLTKSVAGTSTSLDELVFNRIRAQKCSSVCKENINYHDTNHFVISYHLAHVPWLIFADYTTTEYQALNRSSDNTLTMRLIGFAVGTIISIIILVHGLILHKKNSIKLMWHTSVLVSLTLIAGICCVWFSSYRLYYLDTSKAITNVSNLNSYLASYEKESKLKKLDKITKIPTSINVTGVEFLNSYNIQITGTVMQRFPKNKEIIQGVKFNGGLDADLNKIADIQSGAFHTVIWSFQVKVRENIDYTHYPFSHGKIWLALSPYSQAQNVVLVPDFSYYNGLTDINAANGIAPNLIIPGWYIRGSYFNYVEDNSRMFDAINSFRGIHLPSLAFNILIGSTFSDALITTIIPPLVIIIILFVTLLTVGKRGNKFIEFKVSSILSSSSGMLFTIVFTHVSLRNKLTSSIMYIEYFYLLMYIVVLLIPINAFLFAIRRYKFINFGNNFLIKISFFPLICLLVFLLSLWQFA